MCVVDLYTEIYPHEIRRKKVTKRCLLSYTGSGACRRTRVYDHGASYHARHPEPNRIPRPSTSRSQGSHPIVEVRPRDASAPPTTRGRIVSSGGEGSRVRFRLPSFGRASDTRELAGEEDGRRPAHQPLPEERYYTPERPSRRVTIVEPPSRSSGGLPFSPPPLPPPRPRAPRPPSPVVEREPVRRRRASVPVEIHNPTGGMGQSARDGMGYSRREDDTLRPGQVRVPRSPDTRDSRRANSYVTTREPSAQGRSPAVRWQEPDNERRSEYRTNNTRRWRQPSPGRGLWSQPPPSTSNRMTSRIRPRIIQEGRRQLSEAGNRIFDEARRGLQERERAVSGDSRRRSWRWL
ncbi:hypothetical protein ASPZODRAFT_175303 [Penicilliopsis zonata CBS 506.65]|uniref:Uncharacterized protein n=1 Tax=Penicilliopsis zonata CBS 506.65 TaxID=1073090 RepID=A0A1L9STC9_9EURO|nr:hypothetical protein ASPZODRAFT_175303 [Penicilliopsis zonata CBS 506.65]OJJ50460.1 hypothetical protein ASPZODRAFT_175303 [Penicilliopsis zonata CBS 506.65]